MDNQDKKNSLVKEWIHKAERDLNTARLTLDHKPEYTDIICYHSQQAVEKYLKAYLVYLNTPFEKKHDLDYLIDLIVENDKDIEQFYDTVEILSGYAVEIRYPDDWSEPNAEEAKAAYEIALNIKKYAVKMIDIK
jgi:HEPN domain-containing protein